MHLPIYFTLVICLFAVTISAKFVRNNSDTNSFTVSSHNFSLSRNRDAKYRNCTDFVISKDGCSWNGSYPVLIDVINSCNFSCFYNPKEDNTGPVRLSVHILSTISNINVFVSARQSHIITSWTLPIIFEEKKNQPYNSIEEVLCPPYTEDNDQLDFRIETSSKEPVNISVSLTRTSFELKLNFSVKVTSTPVSPWIKLYKWEGNQDSVLISAKSVGKKGGRVCTLLSIQNAKCPVGTNVADIMSGNGRYQSFQVNGGMVAEKSLFPDGVFVVILPLPDDRQCTGIEEGFENKTARSKTVEIIVLNHLTMSDKWESFAAVGMVATIVAVGSTFLIAFLIKKNLAENKSSELEEDQTLLTNDELGGSDEIHVRRQVSGGVIFHEGSSSEARIPRENIESENQRSCRNEELPSIERRDVDVGARALPPPPGIQNQLLYLTEGNNARETSNGDLYIRRRVDTLNPTNSHEFEEFTEGNNPRFIYWWKIYTEYTNKKPDTNISEVGFKGNLFLVGVYIALPLSNMLGAYMNVFTYKGADDQCFYNTLCITSFWKFPDFARIYTNIGYLLCGLCFYWIVKLHEKVNREISAGQTLGVSRNYGLFQSLACGLFIQGIISSMYHVCPNRFTLRFDMMFMYVDVVVLIVGVWGLRHGGVTHHVYPTIGLVGAALFAAEAKYWISNGLFWSLVVIIHLIFTITIGAMLCTLGTWSFSPISMLEIWKEMNPISKKLKAYLTREKVDRRSHLTIIRTILGVVSNGVVMAVGTAIDMEVYLYILLVCIVNMGLYIINYIFTKVLLHQERGTKIAWMSLFLSGALWIVALVFFSDHNTNTEATAAVSRKMNSECLLFNSFDSHDLWHLTSAFALFFSFVGILTMDDDLARRNPQKIPVF